MYKNLYDSFARWFNGGQVYFISDPHFGDEEMRNIRDNHPTDDEIVKKINSKIGKNDTLVILGDIGDVNFVKKLRGYKVLVMGNHDLGISNYLKVEKIIPVKDATEEDKKYIESKDCKKRNVLRNIEAYCYDNKLFDEVYEGPLFISSKILLSHEPLLFPNALNIHGHDHSNRLYRDEFHINVCSEIINYTPLCLKEIIDMGIIGKIKDIHRDTIDKRTKNNW